MKHAFLVCAAAAALAIGLACPALAQVSGAFSATLSGFQPTSAYSQLAVSTVSSRVMLPFGTTVIVYNTGASAAYVTLGDSTVTATTSGALIQPQSWMAFTSGSNTYLAGVTSSGTTALTISGGMAGAGPSFPTGSAGSPNANVVSVQGVSGATALPVTGTFWQTTQPVSIASLPALAAGANTIGAVTQASGPWTVNQTQINGAAANTGTGASSAGTARVAVSTDSPGGALANPGYQYLTDGTNTVSVKPASTAAAATDKSLVVQINPQQVPPVSLSRINGSATVTSATGVQEVGIVGHAGVAVDATVAPGAAPTNMIVGGLQYNSSAPTLGSGQTAGLQGDSSGNLKVNVASLPALASGANTIGKVDLLGTSGAPMDVAEGGATAAANALQMGCVYNASAPTLTSGYGGAVQCDSNGRQLVTVANANANGQQTMTNSSPVVIASNQSAIPVNPQLQTAHGLTKVVAIGVTNSGVSIFSGQHQLMKVDCDNNNAALTYLQMFDATAGVTVGATAPSDFKPLQPSSGGGWMASLAGPQYATGLIVAATTGPTNGVASTNAVNCSFFYN